MSVASRPISLLLVEDSPLASRLVEGMLEREMQLACQVRWVASLDEARQQLQEAAFDLVLLDLNLPYSQGLQTFQLLQAAAGSTPIVIMSGDGDEQLALTAVRLGAQDYLVKGRFDGRTLVRAISFARERSQRQEAERRLEQTRSELALARSVQHRLFPQGEPLLVGLDIAGRCQPAASAAGDYYDYFAMADDTIGLVMGDVSGHGLGAALMMVETRAVLRALVTTYRDVGNILTRCDEILAPDIAGRGFVTLFFACLDPRTRCCHFAAAGHPSMLFDARGRLKSVLQSQDPPLGTCEARHFETHGPLTLEAGETLLLYTDGLTETVGAAGQQYGPGRLAEVIERHHGETAEQLLARIFDDVERFAIEPQLDDNTALVVKVAAGTD